MPGLLDPAAHAPAQGLPSNAPATLNMLDLLAYRQCFTRHILNLHEVGPALLAHLRDDALVQPALRPKVEAFAALLRDRLGAQHLHSGWPYQTAPVLTTRFDTPHGELAFFSMFSTFGTPQDITLASLRVEHLFAADAATRAVLAREVDGLPGADSRAALRCAGHILHHHRVAPSFG